MARIGDNVLPVDQELSISLDRYQEIMRLPIAAFNGLNNPDEVPVYECSTIWKQSERDNLAMFLAQAEEMREEELGYHLSPKYIVDEEQTYGVPVILNRKHLVSIGTRAVSTIQAGVTLNLGTETSPNDPVIVTVSTSVVASEIAVLYPGETVEIHPSSVSVVGGVATIQIPRSRLIDPDLLDNRDDHLSYYENDNFLTTVDIARIYIEPSNGAYIVWDSPALVVAGAVTYPSDTEHAQRANVQIVGERAYRLSSIHVYPATTAGAASTFAYCVDPTAIRISYLSGRRSSMLTEMNTIKLAHVLMPNLPCTCPYVQQYWDEDTTVDPSGLVTPYGSKVGAVQAWLSDSRAKVGQGGKFARTRV